MSVEIAYHCHEEMADPVFGVALFRNDGVYVYGTNSAVDGMRMAPALGAGRVRLDYRSLPLLPGTYVLSVAVFDGADKPALDHRDQRYRFRVLGTSGEHGVTRFAHDWALVKDPADQRRVG